MREWDDITRDILKRRDEQIAHDKAQMRTVRRAAVSALCVCLVAAAGIGIWINGPDKSELMNGPDKTNIISDEPVTSSIVSTVPAVTYTTDVQYDVTTTAVDNPHISTSYSTSYAPVQNVTTVQAASMLPVLSKVPAAATITTGSAQQTDAPKNTIVTTAVTEPIDVIQTTVTEKKPDPNTTTEIRYDVRYETMKTYFEFLAAAAIAVNIAPVYRSPIVYSPTGAHNDYSAYYEAFDNGEIEKDMNGDGNFDIRDLFVLYQGINEHGDHSSSDYLTPEEEARVQAIGDIDNNGVVSGEDYYILNYYYNYKKGIIPSDYEIDNYRDRAGNLPSYSWDFIFDLRLANTNSAAIYNFTESYNNTNNVDLDFNCDGTVDITDIYLYYFFGYNMEVQNLYQKCDPSYIMIDGYDPGEYANDTEDSFLTPEAFEKCMDYYTSHYYSLNSNGFLLKYFMQNNMFSADWIDQDNYISYITAYTNALGHNDRFTNDIINNSSNDYAFIGEARTIAVELGYMDFSIDDYRNGKYMAALPSGSISADYQAYVKAVNNETKPAPDVNHDGIMDTADIDDIVDYYYYKNNYELFTRLVPMGISNITPETYDYLKNDFDINNNGISGDEFDLISACMYIVNNNDVPFDVMAQRAKRKDFFEFISSSVNLVNRPAAVEPDKDPLVRKCKEIYGPYVSQSVIDKYVQEQTIWNKYWNDEITFEEADAMFMAIDPELYSCGDTDCDGQVKMNDAVLVMQFLSNGDKYDLNDEEIENADVYNTGDGLTPMDALTIQKILLN